MTRGYEIRAGSPMDDPVIADCFGKMWRDSPVPPEALVDDWFERTMVFIEAARADGTFLSYLAQSDGEAVGSLAVQQFSGLYPDVLRTSYRRHAYVWGVFVSTERRREGIASALVERSLADLRRAGYSRVLLHASVMGSPVYEALGFTSTNEMQIDMAA
jgi:ribosomal protein S18 acetylase RimI-like enzyme